MWHSCRRSAKSGIASAEQRLGPCERGGRRSQLAAEPGRLVAEAGHLAAEAGRLAAEPSQLADNIPAVGTVREQGRRRGEVSQPVRQSCVLARVCARVVCWRGCARLGCMIMEAAPGSTRVEVVGFRGNRGSVLGRLPYYTEPPVRELSSTSMPFDVPTDGSSASCTGAGVGEAVGAPVVGTGVGALLVGAAVGAVLVGAAVGGGTVGATVGAAVGGGIGDDVGVADSRRQLAMPVPTRQRWS